MRQHSPFLAALRANLAPALVLWSAAALLLAFYYTVVPVQAALNDFARFKSHLGLLFVMPAQAIAGGLLPFLFQRLQRAPSAPIRAAHVPFLMAVWACVGALHNTFYMVQAYLFGDNPAPMTVLLKVALDQLIYTPFVSIPFVMLFYDWKEAGFRWRLWFARLQQQWYRSRVLPVYSAALWVWTPTVCVLYALPLALQFPVQVVVQCFWGLILVFMTSQHPAPAETT